MYWNSAILADRADSNLPLGLIIIEISYRGQDITCGIHSGHRLRPAFTKSCTG